MKLCKPEAVVASGFLRYNQLIFIVDIYYKFIR